jgi:hypothetical protein
LAIDSIQYLAVRPVVAGAAGQDQHAVDLLEDVVGAVAKQLGHDAGDAFQRVADHARLLEDFFCM